MLCFSSQYISSPLQLTLSFDLFPVNPHPYASPLKDSLWCPLEEQQQVSLNYILAFSKATGFIRPRFGAFKPNYAEEIIFLTLQVCIMLEY